MISSNSHAIKRPFSSASSNTSFVTPYASLDLPKPSGQVIRPNSVHAQSVAGKLQKTKVGSFCAKLFCTSHLILVAKFDILTTTNVHT